MFSSSLLLREWDTLATQDRVKSLDPVLFLKQGSFVDGKAKNCVIYASDTITIDRLREAKQDYENKGYRVICAFLDLKTYNFRVKRMHGSRSAAEKTSELLSDLRNLRQGFDEPWIFLFTYNVFLRESEAAGMVSLPDRIIRIVDCLHPEIVDFEMFEVSSKNMFRTLKSEPGRSEPLDFERKKDTTPKGPHCSFYLIDDQEAAVGANSRTVLALLSGLFKARFRAFHVIDSFEKVPKTDDVSYARVSSFLLKKSQRQYTSVPSVFPFADPKALFGIQDAVAFSAVIWRINATLHPGVSMHELLGSNNLLSAFHGSSGKSSVSGVCKSMGRTLLILSSELKRYEGKQTISVILKGKGFLGTSFSASISHRVLNTVRTIFFDDASPSPSFQSLHSLLQFNDLSRSTRYVIFESLSESFTTWMQAFFKLRKAKDKFQGVCMIIISPLVFHRAPLRLEAMQCGFTLVVPDKARLMEALSYAESLHRQKISILDEEESFLKYKCPAKSCEYSAMSEWELQSHVPFIHGGDPVIEKDCPICGTKFSDMFQGGFNVHLNNYHGFDFRHEPSHHPASLAAFVFIKHSFPVIANNFKSVSSSARMTKQMLNRTSALLKGGRDPGKGSITLVEKILLVIEPAGLCGGESKLFVPAGRLDRGEDFSTGALREAEEEAGLKIQLTGLVSWVEGAGLGFEAELIDPGLKEEADLIKSLPDFESLGSVWVSGAELKGLKGNEDFRENRAHGVIKSLLNHERKSTNVLDLPEFKQFEEAVKNMKRGERVRDIPAYQALLNHKRMTKHVQKVSL